MKAFYSFCLALLAAALLAGCGNHAKSAADTKPTGVAAVKQAVQAFNTKEGHFPKTLDELTPTYLDKIPDAPGGYKYAYDPAKGEVTLRR
jgi:hypothetical protein